MSADPNDRNVLVRHYEACFAKHGATPRGVNWPGGADLARRFAVMLQPIADMRERPELLDLGCGPGLLLDYLAANGRLDRVKYRGIDLSRPMIESAQKSWPMHDFSCRDILADPLPDQSFDFVVMNGVLTERASLDVASMTALAEALVTAAFRAARIGIAFNAMNFHVDWQRDDLFHWSFDALAAFLKREVSRHYMIHAAYGLYEYTCFVWREPLGSTVKRPDTW
jgi:SAM-dependent methyltransferase